MAEQRDDASSPAVLGYGQAAADDLSDLDAAMALALPGGWFRLYLTAPRPWRASTLVLSAGLKRVSDDTMAFEWQNDGSGLGSRRQVISALIAGQTQHGEMVIWQLEQLAGIPSQGGVQTLAPTSPPFGWELPKPTLPTLPTLPDFKTVGTVAVLGVITLLLLKD